LKGETNPVKSTVERSCDFESYTERSFGLTKGKYQYSNQH